MKTLLLFISIIFCSINLGFAQTVIYEDNFESYAHNYNLTGSGYAVWEGTARASNMDSIAGDTAFEGKVFGKSDSGKNNFAFRKTITLEAGKTYTWEIATKIQDGVKYFLQVNPTDTYQKVEKTNAEWEKTTVDFTVQAGSEEVTLAVYRWAKKVVSFDGFKLTESVATNKKDVSLISLNIYPNPSSGVVHLNSTKILKAIKVFDSCGRELVSNTNVNKDYFKIDLNKFTKGLYIIQAEDLEGIITNKRLLLN